MRAATAAATVFFIASFALAITAVEQYAGNAVVYFAFTFAAVALVANGFHRGAFFIDTFIGIFLWLGFWLKFSVRIAFLDARFWEPVGAFDGSPQALDHALIVATIGMMSALLAAIVRRRFFRHDLAPGETSGTDAVSQFYLKHRATIVGFFVATVIAVSASNVLLGVYQRGMQPETFLPWGLGGVYKWLLQFGLASFAALIVRYEMQAQGQLTWVAIVVPLVESFLSNVSMFSRGMVLNVSAIACGIWRFSVSLGRHVTPRRSAIAIVTFLVLFASSVIAVNYLRSYGGTGETGGRSVERATAMTTPLFIDRWVGIEGVLAVASSDKLGWDIWAEAWRETFADGVLSLYDREFIDSPYRNPELDMRRHHFVSLPGAIAFFYYPGSLWVLVACVAVFVWLGSAIEWAAYVLSGKNLILCALIGQVIAFRFASFGYVPRQSYLLFGTIVLNIILIALLIGVIKKYADRTHSV